MKHSVNKSHSSVVGFEQAAKFAASMERLGFMCDIGFPKVSEAGRLYTVWVFYH